MAGGTPLNAGEPRPGEARAPWLAAGLLPEADPDAVPGVWWEGRLNPMSLEGMEAALRVETEQTQAPVLLVGLPDEARLRFVQQVPELRSALEEKDARQLRKARKNSALAFYPLAALTVTWGALGAWEVLFLPALFAVDQGTRHVEAWRELRLLQRRPDQFYAARVQQLRFAYWLAQAKDRDLLATWLLGGAWILLFILQLVVGMDGAVARAALVKPLAREDEAWRILTAAMMHGGLYHIVMNFSAWASLAPLLERTVSRHLLAPVWLLGALGGGLCSLLLSEGTSVGASGGLLGLVGFLSVLGWRRRALLPPDFGRNMLRSVGYMAVFGALAWAVIDNAAHAGGFAAGILLGLAVFRDAEGCLPLPESPGLRVLGWSAQAFCLGLAGFTALKLLGRL
jgi:rhomboid protease GluP